MTKSPRDHTGEDKRTPARSKGRQGLAAPNYGTIAQPVGTGHVFSALSTKGVLKGDSWSNDEKLANRFLQEATALLQSLASYA
ncbi:MAG TPA: hypothetical protein PKL73_03335 [Polyangiaceae bacterium]|jgi:hypothetical protein|nr:hypothetical protein [Polyangiaceae bacterium]HNZ22637.1 hypothetical protein [Polyangiaceae bacterium]HOE48364.1 hypothetical protein [Polyangiaceae bacterium]HOH00306.1 hypothetical protein [Polyangiaceae bacterium]HOR35598.1 hypothetical protein [Polyangiaceae bacterium]